ncbi:MAG: hypothetical protein ACRYG8_50705 [Janthinobacterium lividum]
MSDDPTPAELLTIWPSLADEARQSLPRIAQGEGDAWLAPATHLPLVRRS